MRPLNVSTAMFAIAARTVSGESCPPELVKILFEYVEKLEAAQQSVKPTVDGHGEPTYHPIRMDGKKA